MRRLGNARSCTTARPYFPLEQSGPRHMAALEAQCLVRYRGHTSSSSTRAASYDGLRNALSYTRWSNLLFTDLGPRQDGGSRNVIIVYNTFGQPSLHRPRSTSRWRLAKRTVLYNMVEFTLDRPRRRHMAARETSLSCTTPLVTLFFTDLGPRR